MSQIAIIGAGAWGTGLAIVLGRKESHRVRLWAYEADVCDSINRNHVNNRFLPGVRLPDSVRASNDFSIVLDGAEIIVSGDDDLLVLHPWRGVRILRPADYLALT